MHPFDLEITRKIRQQALVGRDEHTVVVAVSGGPDSVALLHLLLLLREESDLQLVAAYINHGLRPAESDDEESFVSAMCGGLGIPFATERVAAREYAKERKKSLEHAARDLRYRALREIAANHSAPLIAVGHTADDQAEELLIRLLRGSGRKGLAGMLPRSDGIIRPLLSVRRKDILRYLEEKKIPYCIDSSNTDMRFVRNRIRHSLIPFLEENFDRGVRAALCKTADSLAADEELLDDLAEKALAQVVVSSDAEAGPAEPRVKIDRHVLAGLPKALQRRAVEKLLWRLHCRATYTHIMKIVDAAVHGRTGAEVHLRQGLRVGVQRRYLELLYPRGRSPWRGRLYDR